MYPMFQPKEIHATFFLVYEQFHSLLGHQTLYGVREALQGLRKVGIVKTVIAW